MKRVAGVARRGRACSPSTLTAQQRRHHRRPDAWPRAYDLVLDADFDGLPALPSTCPPAPPVACLGLEALSLWWQIQLDPESLRLDAPFMAKANAAIAEAERMTTAEPERAEAWFYLGAAYGVRAQWRVQRVERLAAARDGKRIKESLERALALDPEMHDAEFGIGMYRYYADVAPAVLRLLRWLLLLPGGDRVDGLRQLERAATQRRAGARRSAVPDPRGLPLVRAEVAAGAGARPRTAVALPAATRCSGRSRRRSSTCTSTIAAASLTASEQLLALARSRRGASRRPRRGGGAPQHRAQLASRSTARSRAPTTRSR